MSNRIPRTRCLGFEFVLNPTAGDPLSHSLDFNGDGIISKDEREFDVFDWTVSWTRDSRNHFLNPTRGSAQSLTLQTALPGSSREYYKLYYRGAKYWPIWGGLVFSVRGNMGYGDAYDSYDKRLAGTRPETRVSTLPLPRTAIPPTSMQLDTGLPFFEHFYSGGVRDLRGYDDNTLGPKDAFCRSSAVTSRLPVAWNWRFRLLSPPAAARASRCSSTPATFTKTSMHSRPTSCGVPSACR